MGYKFELSAEQSVYLENLGDQTRVTLMSSSPGQQQQSSSSFQTGTWTVTPDAFRAAIGVVVKLCTAQGDRFLHVQGNHVKTLPDAPSLREAHPIPVQSVAQVPVSAVPAMLPMEPMPPMEPMTMSDLSMGRGGMSMQMGNMRMSMNSIAHSQGTPSPAISSLNTPSPTHPSSTNVADGAEAPPEQRHFCSQCGVTVKPSDRFCASCGYRLD